MLSEIYFEENKLKKISRPDNLQDRIVRHKKLSKRICYRKHHHCAHHPEDAAFSIEVLIIVGIGVRHAGDPKGQF